MQISGAAGANRGAAGKIPFIILYNFLHNFEFQM